MARFFFWGGGGRGLCIRDPSFLTRAQIRALGFGMRGFNLWTAREVPKARFFYDYCLHFYFTVSCPSTLEMTQYLTCVPALPEEGRCLWNSIWAGSPFDLLSWSPPSTRPLTLGLAHEALRWLLTDLISQSRSHMTFLKGLESF